MADAGSRPTLYILDAFSRIYQIFHAIREPMASPSGVPTSAVFGLFRDLLNLRNKVKPDYLLVAYDGMGQVFRSEIHPDYKATRKEMPDDLRPQIDLTKRLFQAFRVPILLREGYEADDVIATVARAAVAKGLDVVILTSDKDARQLLGPNVRILNLRDGKILDEAGLMSEWGIRPEQVVDYLALTGDAVDNVPGVPSIGPGYAQKLLREYGTLENAIANVESAGKVIGPARQKKLAEHTETARRARTLVELKDDVPIEFDWDAWRHGDYDLPALKDLCTECGFHQFRKEIGGDDKQAESAWSTDRYAIVDSLEKLDAFARELALQPRFSFDTETTGLDPLQSKIVGLGFCWREGEAHYIPIRAPLGVRTLDLGLTLEKLRPIFANPEVEVIGQNIKFDLLVMKAAGVAIAGPVSDTMILSFLLESGERNHSLDQLSRRLLDHTMISIESLIGKGKKQRRMDEIDVPAIAEYCGEDADAAWRIEAILRPKLETQGLWPLYAEVERPLIQVLARMEETGIKVDLARLRQLSKEFGTRLESIRGEIHQLAGREFNIGSGPQLRQILFEELGLPVVKRTPKGEPSTDADVLETLAPSHGLPRLIVQYRHLEKLKSTYLDALTELTDDNQRIHTSFSQVVASTGRLSSSDPNLQNIPTRTEDGKQIRQAFIAGEPGWRLLTADYSQIELRVLAHFSRDKALMKAFEDDRDIHAAVAAKVYGVSEAHVTKDQRRVAKMVNFGIVYGLSAFGLASRLGIPQSDATEFIDSYFKEYPGVELFMTKAREQALNDGRVETILGRRRAISGVKNTTGRNLNLGERLAVNTIIQGSAADLIKKAMLDVDRRITERGLASRMLLQIHDELVFEAPASEIAELADLVRDAMTKALDLCVPLKVDLAHGPNWLDVEPM